MTNDPISSLANFDEEHIRRAETVLAEFADPHQNTDRWIPIWSNYDLQRSLKKFLKETGSDINNIFRGLWNLLSHTHAPLTPTIIYFQRAIYYFPFSSYHYSHPRVTREQLDFTWIVSGLKEGCTPAQAYLTLSVLNEEQLATCKSEILAALKDSEYLEHALHTEGIRSPDTLPYGNYQIEPIEVESIVADVVCYSLEGAWIGKIMHQVVGKDAEQWVKAFYPRIPAPFDWQALIQKRLGEEANEE